MGYKKMLTKNQFEILSALKCAKKPLSELELSEITKISLEKVNDELSYLSQYISDGVINNLGDTVLEPYKVNRAILICAGIGSRLVPITLNTPKALIRVNGKRLIDNSLDALLAAGINEIYIIRGYLGEQFDQLLYKYPMIKFIDNPIYDVTNNISSILKANELVSNSYILEGDLLLYNPEIIKPYQYESNYIGMAINDKTNEWVMETENNRVVNVTIGGESGYQLYGVSYWTKEDGLRLASDIKEIIEEPGGKDLFFDMVPLFKRKADYKVYVREYNFGDIIEIDTFDELKQLDDSYNV